MKLKWYHFIIAFLAGVFFINSLPHFLNGISGNYFTSPFADPPGKGLSPPIINVIWGTINFIISFLLFYFGKITKQKKYIWIAVFTGALATAVLLALYFTG
jgi:hypothetical protein